MAAPGNPEENAGSPLVGNPDRAAVLYPGKIVFAFLPYAWAARMYVMAHTGLGVPHDAGLDAAMADELDQVWHRTYKAIPSGHRSCANTSNVIYLGGGGLVTVGACTRFDRWVRMGRQQGLIELAIVTVDADQQEATRSPRTSWAWRRADMPWVWPGFVAANVIAESATTANPPSHLLVDGGASSLP